MINSAGRVLSLGVSGNIFLTPLSASKQNKIKVFTNLTILIMLSVGM
jgi:hypothetical protein